MRDAYESFNFVPN